MEPKQALEPTAPETKPVGLTLTARQVFETADAFVRLSEQRPIGNPRMAYNLAKSFREFKKEAEALQEQKVEIFKAFGAEKVGEQYSLRPEQMTPEFHAALKEMLEIPIELWGHTIPFADIEAARIDLSPADLIALEWLIVE